MSVMMVGDHGRAGHGVQRTHSLGRRKGEHRMHLSYGLSHYRARASHLQTPKVTAAGNCFPNRRRELGKGGGRRVTGVGSEIGTKSVKWYLFSRNPT